MGRPSMSHADFCAKLKSAHGSSIVLTSKYVNYRTKVGYRVKKCKHVGTTFPGILLACKGCPDCNKHHRRSENLSSVSIFKRALRDKFGSSIKLLSADLGDSKMSKALFQCASCGYTFETLPADMLRRTYGCYTCSRNARRKSHSTYVAELKELLPTVQVAGYYVDGRSKIAHKCFLCNNEWVVKPQVMLHNPNCPKCHRKTRTYSKKAVSWLNGIAEKNGIFIKHAENGGEFILTLLTGKKIRVDGFCEATNTVYEFHGDYFHGNLEMFPPNSKPNPYSNKTAYRLYLETCIREELIRASGYKLKTMWERSYC